MNPFQRRYMKDIIRVQEIERRLGMIETHLTSREVRTIAPLTVLAPPNTLAQITHSFFFPIPHADP